MTRLTLLIGIWFLFWSGNSSAQNRKLVDSLERVVQSDAPDTLKLKAYYGLTWQNLRFDLARSRSSAGHALQLARKLEDSTGMHRVYHYWGLIHRLESNYDSSLYYFQQVVDFFTRRGEPSRTLQARFNMGVVSSFQGLYRQSSEHYLKALQLAEAVSDPYMKAEVLNSLGIINKKLKNYPKALDMTFEALKVAIEIGDSSQQANYLSNIGGLHAEMQSLDSALLYFHQALAIDSAQNMQWGVGHQLTNIGQVYMDQGNWLQASHYLTKGLEIREQLGQPKEIGESLAKLATLYNLQDKGRLAQITAKRAQTIGLQLGDRPLLRDAYQELAKANGNLGNFKPAFQFQKAYSTLNDSILNESTIEQINTLQIQYETEQKESEIALLKQDKTIQEATILQQKTEINALIGIFILSLLLTGLLYLLYRIRIKHQQEIQKQQAELHQRELLEVKQNQKIVAMESMLTGQEQERKRIAKDLHDGLGNLLANVQMQFSTLQEKLPSEKLPSYNTTYRLLTEACGEVRKIAHDMMPSALTRFGLVDALHDLGKVLKRSTALDVDIQVYGFTERLPENLEIALYRILQELLNNILKHAQATSVIIQLSRLDNELNLLVEDNGIGFDLEQVTQQAGLGLQSLQDRARSMDATLELDTAPGRGTAVIVQLPFPVSKPESIAN